MNEIDHTYWYFSRSAGFAAYLLLFVSVVFGLTMTGGLLERFLRRYRVYDLHRYLSLLTLIVVIFHILIVLPDDFTGFSLQELLIPFNSPYRALYTAVGAFSFYLTVFIVCSFYLRPLVPYRAWRLIHYITYGAFILALAHGIGAGTDSGAAWARLLYIGTGWLVFVLFTYRLLWGAARPGVPAVGGGLRLSLPRTKRGTTADRVPEASKPSSSRAQSL